jgi:ATP-binding cassette subfamily B protein
MSVSNASGVGRSSCWVVKPYTYEPAADSTPVLGGSRLVESGTHEALMTKGGQYAEPYRIQAAAYR